MKTPKWVPAASLKAPTLERLERAGIRPTSLPQKGKVFRYATVEGMTSSAERSQLLKKLATR